MNGIHSIPRKYFRLDLGKKHNQKEECWIISAYIHQNPFTFLIVHKLRNGYLMENNNKWSESNCVWCERRRKKYVANSSKPTYTLESQFDNDKRIRHFHFYRIFFHLKSGYLQSSNFAQVEIVSQRYFIVFPCSSLRFLCLFSFADGSHSVFPSSVLSLTRLKKLLHFIIFIDGITNKQRKRFFFLNGMATISFFLLRFVCFLPSQHNTVICRWHYNNNQ